MNKKLTHHDYAFVIVGGGSAGCLLARLLAEQKRGRVALLEAGTPNHNVRTQVPAFYPRTFGTTLDWGFTTEPQSGLSGRKIIWPRGKTLGGSGAINAMIHLQAAEADFKRWSANGCNGLELASTGYIAAKRNEDSADTKLVCPVANLPLATVANPHPWTLAFLDAAESWGLQRICDWTQAQNQSCGLFALTQSSGRRAHTGQFLDAAEIQNLDVFTGYLTSRLEVQNHKVIGIELFDGTGETSYLPIGANVILSAGTIGSPSILLRSGIGPAAHLESIGIAVQLDLIGVGANLQDHLVYPVVYSSNQAEGMPRRFSRTHRKAFREQGSGPLASNIAEAGALFTAPSSHAQSEATPDFQIHFTPTHYLKYPISKTDDTNFSLAVTDLHPRSRGRLQLVDNSPHSQPILDPAYLNDPQDIERLILAVQACRDLVTQPSLKQLIREEAIPGAKRIEPKAIERSIRMLAQSIYHPIGTCRMGTDALAVVDSDFRVHGLGNLQIADASVLPDLPSANTNAVTLLLAATLAKKFMDRP